MSPEPASYDPEEFVDGSQPWPRLLALKDGELLAKGEIFEHQTAARPKPAKHGSEPEPKQVKHGNQVIADRLCRLPCEVVDFTAGQDCDEGQSRTEGRCRDRSSSEDSIDQLLFSQIALDKLLKEELPHRQLEPDLLAGDPPRRSPQLRAGEDILKPVLPVEQLPRTFTDAVYHVVGARPVTLVCLQLIDG